MYPDGPSVPAYRPYPAAVVDVPDPLPDGRAAFTDDIRAALGVWRRFPALPLLTTMFAILAAVASTRWAGAPLAGIVALVFLGWVGSERIWYLRAYTGRTLSVRAALRASLAYWGRFVALSLWLMLLTVPLYTPAFVYGGVFDQQRIEDHEALPLWAIVYLSVGSLLIDFLLTFVTPALVYNTRRARSAIRIGLHLLRRTWPHAALYVLFPPLAVLLLTRFSSGPVGWGGAALIVASSLVNLVAKGAVAAYYLRLMPITEPDGDID
jgi:hypothetical protein